MVQISSKDIKINLERITALSKHRVETKRTNRPAGSNVTAVVFENVKTHSNKKNDERREYWTYKKRAYATRGEYVVRAKSQKNAKQFPK